MDREKVLQDLRTIPGVGISISHDLWNLGIRSVGELKNRSPEMLYKKHCILVDQPVDRCLLYVFRCAVYYASHKRHDPELLLCGIGKIAKDPYSCNLCAVFAV